MALDREAGPAFELADRTLEPGILERLDPPAFIAHDVMVMLSAGEDRLEACTVEAHLDAMHVAVADELIERAVDAGDPDPMIVRAEPIEDLLRTEAARLLPEKLDDGAPGASAAFQGGQRLLGPLRGP